MATSETVEVYLHTFSFSALVGGVNDQSDAWPARFSVDSRQGASGTRVGLLARTENRIHKRDRTEVPTPEDPNTGFLVSWPLMLVEGR
jgi:hypothetical protein